jgi:hypothetical protein
LKRWEVWFSSGHYLQRKLISNSQNSGRNLMAYSKNLGEAVVTGHSRSLFLTHGRLSFLFTVACFGFTYGLHRQDK